MTEQEKTKQAIVNLLAKNSLDFNSLELGEIYEIFEKACALQNYIVLSFLARAGIDPNDEKQVREIAAAFHFHALVQTLSNSCVDEFYNKEPALVMSEDFNRNLADIATASVYDEKLNVFDIGETDFTFSELFEAVTERAASTGDLS